MSFCLSPVWRPAGFDWNQLCKPKLPSLFCLRSLWVDNFWSTLFKRKPPWGSVTLVSRISVLSWSNQTISNSQHSPSCLSPQTTIALVLSVLLPPRLPASTGSSCFFNLHAPPTVTGCKQMEECSGRNTQIYAESCEAMFLFQASETLLLVYTPT